MQILQFTVGATEIPEGKGVEVTHKKNMSFVENLKTSQKIKITKSLENLDITIEKTPDRLTVIENDINKAVMQQYELTAKDKDDIIKVIAGVNKYSFNPFISKVNKGFENVTEERGLIFVELDTNEIIQLRYYTNMEIIGTISNKKRHHMGCLLSFDKNDSEQKFTLYGINNSDRFVSYTIDMDDDGYMQMTMSDLMSMKMIQNLRSIVSKYNKRPLQYKYSASVVPSKVLCFNDDTEEVLESIKGFTGRESEDDEYVMEDYEFITINPEQDLTDKNIVAAICNNKLSKTRAVLLGPNVKLTGDTLRELGISYLFIIIHDEKNGYRLIQTKPM